MGPPPGVTRLLDTSTLVDFLRGDTNTIAAMQHADVADLVTSTVVVEELFAGTALARDSHLELFRVESLLRPIRVLPFDEKSARAAGLLRVMLQQKGTPIGNGDRMIAATAIAHDASMVTSNVREFARVPGLIVEDWRAA
ncbi:MAG: type II toxin-antitoxin system VapC family toxin [Actinobacteria bacterium]|nr:type II toxin-antitoxin system VapC family toxin [Actinomycetota bacterium]